MFLKDFNIGLHLQQGWAITTSESSLESTPIVPCQNRPSLTYTASQSAVQFHPMRIVSVVLMFDTWEICFVLCKHKLSFVYKIVSKSPMYLQSKQLR